MTTNRTCRITVENHFDGPATIKLSHRSGKGGTVSSTTWTSLAAGSVADPPFTVNFQTGAFSPWDYWHVAVEVQGQTAQAGRWENDGFKECYLTEDDENGLHSFSVSDAGGFKINMVSSGCSAGMRKID